MGYYSGNGVVTGGNESTRCLKSFYEWGSFAVRQKSVQSTTVKRGVSLETAQGTHVQESLSAVAGGSGSLAWIIFDAVGSRVVPSYARIGDSNLFELTVTTEHLSAWKSSSSTRSLN